MDSFEEHHRRGTFRADRHAHLHPVDIDPADPWKPTATQLKALPKAGRAFLERMLDAHEFSTAEGELLMEAASVAASLDAVRRRSRRGKSLRDIAAIERLELGWSRQFLAILSRLQVTE